MTENPNLNRVLNETRSCIRVPVQLDFQFDCFNHDRAFTTDCNDTEPGDTWIVILQRIIKEV